MLKPTQRRKEVKKIKFTCPHCEAKLRVPTHLAGVSAPCPKCGSTITAPSDITTAVVDPPVSRRPAPVPATAGAPARMPSEPTHAPRTAAAVLEPAPVPLQEARLQAAPAPAPAPAVEAPAPDPAFFTPPPPVLPSSAPKDGQTSLHAPPLPVQDDSSILVEEHYFAETPPLPPLSITQPIHISRTPEELPLSRGAVLGGESLPRLDISLAEQESDPAATLSLGEPTRTRVFLPQPGSSSDPTRPEDFLVSPAPPTKAELPPPMVAEPPALPEPEEGMPTLEDFEDLAQIELPASESHFTSIPLPPEMAPIPLDDLEVENHPMEEPEPGLQAEEPEPGTEEPLDEFEPESLDLFDLPEWQPTEAPAPPTPSADPRPATENASAPLQNPVVDTAPRRPSTDEDLFDVPSPHPLHEGSFGKLFAQQATEETAASTPPATSPPAGPPPMPPSALIPSRAERDESFERMFGDGERTSGSKATLIAMIAAIVIVAIVATVGVIVIVNSFGGGFSTAEDYAKDPDAKEEPAKKPSVSMPRIPTSSETADAPDLSSDEPPAAIIDAPAISRDEAARPAPGDTPALSFDEKASEAVNGTRGGSVIGAPGLDLIDPPATDFSGAVRPAAPAGTPSQPSQVPEPETKVAPGASTTPPGEAPGGAFPAEPATPRTASPMAKSDPNYNPPDSFAAPSADDKSTLGKTHDVIDAFLRAPDAATRVKYTFNGDSLRPAIEDYHKKWPYHRFDRYSLQLYQIETDTSLGGPYWVFIVSTSDSEEGFPLIVRTENGLLKIDWEIFAEFFDRHFLRFRDGTMTPPATFRLIIERFSDYYGSDRDAFTDLGDHYIYQVNPPYGDLNEFSEFVFVKKDSDIAKKLDSLVKLGDDPLAVVVKLDQKPFAHGVKHIVITELVTEGWFR